MTDQAGPARGAVAAVGAVLEYWLMSSAVRHDKTARPVVFKFLVSERLALSFVPAAQGPLIREGVVEGAAATVLAHPNALFKMLTQPDADVSQFAWSVEGDPTALEPIVRALAASAEKKSVIGIRVSDEGSSS
jgi:hypothetical protein